MSETARYAKAMKALLVECKAHMDEWERRYGKRQADKTFGWNAARNPRLMSTLKKGGSPRPGTADKVRAYLDEWNAIWKAEDRAAKAKRK